MQEFKSEKITQYYQLGAMYPVHKETFLSLDVGPCDQLLNPSFQLIFIMT